MSKVTEEADPLAIVRHRVPLMRGGTNYGLLDSLTGFSLKLAWVLGHALLNNQLGEGGVTPHRFSVLEVIGCNPGMQQTQLASALAMSRSATTLAVDFWEARGCVERRPMLTDRRSFGVFLTRPGEEELERLRGIVQAADAKLTAALSKTDSAELRRLLAKIHQ